MGKRWLKLLAGVLLLFIGFICLRMYHVQTGIKNLPVVISDLSESGYTPQGVYGHGDVTFNGGQLGWYVYDLPAPNGLVKKVCANGGVPTPEMDLDFFISEGQWIKLRSGELVLKPNGYLIRPPTQRSHGGIVSQTAFPVRSPDWPYRAKIIWSKLRHGSLSPREYLQSLKASNPSCQDIPEP